MKKIFTVMLVALVSLSASAQKGETAVGVNASYGTQHKAIGIGVKGQYGITDAIRAEASFDYFLKKDGLSMWDINVNAHYLFKVADNFKVYPLVGVAYTNWKADYADEIKAMYEESIKMAKDLGLNSTAKELESQMEAELDDASATTSKFGINIGAGVQYDLTQKLSINLEGKYQIISDFDQPIFTVGLAYKF